MSFPLPLLPLPDQVLLVFQYLSDTSLVTVLQITDAEWMAPILFLLFTVVGSLPFFLLTNLLALGG